MADGLGVVLCAFQCFLNFFVKFIDFFSFFHNENDKGGQFVRNCSSFKFKLANRLNGNIVEERFRETSKHFSWEEVALGSFGESAFWIFGVLNETLETPNQHFQVASRLSR